MILAATVLTVLLALTLYHREESIQLEQMRAKARLEVLSQKQLMEHELKQVIHALLFFNRQADLHDVFTSEEGEKQISEDFTSFMLSSTVFDQARILARNGRELIRVNYNGGVPVAVDRNHLQNKADRYYFQAMQLLARDQLYISALDLNMENGLVERPFKPTLRVGMPVYAADKQSPAGYIIMNYLAGGMLNRFRDSGLLVQGDLLLVNQDGYLLSAPRHEQEWGFMLPAAAAFNVASTTPAVWTAIMQQDAGMVSDHQGDSLLSG